MRQRWLFECQGQTLYVVVVVVSSLSTKCQRIFLRSLNEIVYNPVFYAWASGIYWIWQPIIMSELLKTATMWRTHFPKIKQSCRDPFIYLTELSLFFFVSMCEGEASRYKYNWRWVTERQHSFQQWPSQTPTYVGKEDDILGLKIKSLPR